jgi:hypothetical protein
MTPVQQLAIDTAAGLLAVSEDAVARRLQGQDFGQPAQKDKLAFTLETQYSISTERPFPYSASSSALTTSRWRCS